MRCLIAMVLSGLVIITAPVGAKVVNVAQEQRTLYQRDQYLIEVLEQALKAAIELSKLGLERQKLKQPTQSGAK